MQALLLVLKILVITEIQFLDMFWLVSIAAEVTHVHYLNFVEGYSSDTRFINCQQEVYGWCQF